MKKKAKTMVEGNTPPRRVVRETSDSKDISVAIETFPSIRQSPTGELTESDVAAFFSIGFTHHMEILFKCRSLAERWYYIRKTAMEFWNVEDSVSQSPQRKEALK